MVIMGNEFTSFIDSHTSTRGRVLLQLAFLEGNSLNFQWKKIEHVGEVGNSKNDADEESYGPWTCAAFLFSVWLFPGFENGWHLCVTLLPSPLICADSLIGQSKWCLLRHRSNIHGGEELHKNCDLNLNKSKYCFHGRLSSISRCPFLARKWWNVCPLTQVRIGVDRVIGPRTFKASSRSFRKEL